MVLDHVVALPAEDQQGRMRWQDPSAGRSVASEAATRPQQALFAIVQGGLNETLRVQCKKEPSATPSPATRWEA